MGLGPLLALLWANRFDVDPDRMPLLVLALVTAPFNSLWGGAQHLIFRRRLQRVGLNPAPLFIIGHFRTGTTLLHNLLSLDPRWAAPSTYACFAPGHFLLSRRWLEGPLRRLLPRRRPMDNVTVHFRHPQEEEIALLVAGAPTILRAFAFVRRPVPDLWTLDLADPPPGGCGRLERAYLGFLRAVALDEGRPLLLKSPSHTGRIAWLLRLFPEACFVYVSRDPDAVLRSTRHFWQAMAADHGFQAPVEDLGAIDRAVAAVFDRMMAGLEQGRAAVSPERILELRYEDLVAHPIDQIRRLYVGLGITLAPAVETAMRAQLDAVGAYRTNSLADQPLPAILPARLEAYRAAHRRRLADTDIIPDDAGG